jgi:hypothetical protein
VPYPFFVGNYHYYAHSDGRPWDSQPYDVVLLQNNCAGYGFVSNGTGSGKRHDRVQMSVMLLVFDSFTAIPFQSSLPVPSAQCGNLTRFFADGKCLWKH